MHSKIQTNNNSDFSFLTTEMVLAALDALGWLAVTTSPFTTEQISRIKKAEEMIYNYVASLPKRSNEKELIVDQIRMLSVDLYGVIGNAQVVCKWLPDIHTY